jgi:hypothetical protein
MTFPWALYPDRLVNEFPYHWEIVDQPVAYKEALEELEILLSGAYDGPRGGCPVGEIYVDRGDPAAQDFTIGGGLTADGAWHTLNLESIIPDDTATRVLLRWQIKDGAAGMNLVMKSRGNTNAYNSIYARTQVANIVLLGEGQIFFTAGRFVEYNITTGTDEIGLLVRGWWRPAA